MFRATPAELAAVAEVLRTQLQAGRGVRLGETAVVSRKVHTMDPHRPGEVGILFYQDAGQTFYGRSATGEIIHVDVFHQPANVDHYRASRSVREAVEAYLEDRDRWGVPGKGNYVTADLIDIQTATGGGRVTGSLTYGQKASLRKAHRNHLHLTAQLSDDDLPLLFYLVSAAEQEIIRQQLEIRRVERIRHNMSRQKAPADLSAYSSQSDSLLQEGPREGPRGRASQVCREQEQLETALDLADEIGSLDEVQEILDGLARTPTIQRFNSELFNQNRMASEVFQVLEKWGLTEKGQRTYSLTARGHQIREFIAANRREIEGHLRRLVRRLPFPARNPIRPVAGYARSKKKVCGGHRGAVRAPEGEWLRDIALPETILTAALRRQQEGGGQLAIKREDCYVYRRERQVPLDLCLVIDASASMSGKRIKAAKYLAQHMLLSTRDRVAVMVFQEKEVHVHVPFTRNYSRVQAGLKQIRAYGLTPLAHGLLESIQFVRSCRRRNPLILLITDGIPTVPKWSVNPLQDALEAAANVARYKLNFGCIGLEPNRQYLESLVREARGTLYIVGELEKESLASIAHQERGKLSRTRA